MLSTIQGGQMTTRSPDDFRHVDLAPLGKRVLRLGVASNYGLDEAAVRHAAERGVNFWMWSARMKGATAALRDILKRDREKHVVAMMGMAFLSGGVRRDVDKARKLLGIDYLDIFQLSWLGRTSRFSQGIQDSLAEAREQGVVRAVGCSIHDRKRAGELARDSVLDELMIRYNAAHPGAEQDIFPHLHYRNPMLVSYTATSWRQLLKPLPGIDMPPWPGSEAGPPPLTAPLCYRFVLSSPHVDVALTGPASIEQLDENLDALDRGPLASEEDEWIREYGRKVRSKKKMPFM